MRPLSLPGAASEPRALTLGDTAGVSTARPLSLDGEPKSDLLGALKRGAAISLNPFGVDAKEVTTQRTGAEVAAEVAANVGTDIITSIGASVAAGAVAGSVVPGAGTAVGAAVGVGLGLYRALGYEDLQSRAKGEDFNFGRAALNVATEINPLLKFGGKLAKGATQGTLQTLQALSYGAEGGEAAIAGVVGGVLGGAAHRKGAAKVELPEDKAARATGITASLADPSMSPQSMERMVDLLNEGDNSLMLAREAFDAARKNERSEKLLASVFTKDTVFDTLQNPNTLDTMFDDIDGAALNMSPERMKAATSAVKRQLRQDGIAPDKALIAKLVPNLAKQQELEDEAAGFARFIINKPGEKIGPELFQSAKEKLQKSSISHGQAYDMYRTGKYLKDAATKAAERAAIEGTGLKDPLGMKLFAFFSDLKYAARAIDRTTGLNIEGMTDAVSHKKNLHGTFMYEITSSTNRLLKQAKKIGLGREDITTMLEEGLDRTADGEKGEVLKGFRSLFDTIAEFGTKGGVKVDKIDNYVTRLAQDPAMLKTTLRRRALDYKNGQALLKPGALEDVELHKVLEHVTGIAISGEGDEAALQIQRALNKLDGIQAMKTREGFDATGAFQRRGEIPEFVREMDIGKTMIRYANNMSKSVHMEPIIRQLQTQVPVLEAMGFDSTVKYLQRYIKDLSGQPGEIVGWMNASQSRWKTAIDTLVDQKELTGIMKGGANAAKSLPDFMSWSLSLIYPNYLGLSVKATLRNYLQPTVMGAPELGGTYGHKLTARGWIETLQDKRGGVNLEKTLSERGHLAGQHIGEGMNEAGSSLRATAIGPAIAKIDKFNEAIMYFYSKSDAINRYVTLKMAKQVTKDLLEGVAGGTSADNVAAQKFVRGLSPGVKASVYKLSKEGRTDQIEDLLGRYLVSKTQFNYGPHAASEYGRTMGRMFSMFTKWPTMVAGDLQELAVTQQYRKAAERYLLPIALLGGLGMWIDDTKESPRRRALMGRSLLDISPASALTGVSVPPVITIVGGVIQSAMDVVSLDFEKAGKGIKNSIKALIPIAPAAGRIFDDVNAIMNNKKSTWRESASK